MNVNPFSLDFIRVFTAAFCFASSAFAAEVEAEGKAAGDLPNAREEALTDALREAVRVGVGVDILSSTGVKDFNLEFDRVLTASFGYVKNYKVISSSMGKDGIYRLKVKADVGPGTPGANDSLALKQIVQLKQSPRIVLQIQESIDGIPEGKGYAAGWFEQAAQKMHFQLVDVGAVNEAEAKRASRDEILGNTQSANFRKAGVSQKADFVIQGKITGRYAGQEALFGSLPQHCFEMGAELRAIRPDSGEVVASVLVPASNKYNSELQTKEMAAREILFKVLDGKKGGKEAGGGALFTKIFARWLVELDCGSLKRVELTKIGSADFQKLQIGLKANDKVGAVWEREFDSRAASLIDVETRLTGADLRARVQTILGDAVELDRATENYLQFTAKTGGSAPAPTNTLAPEKSILQRLLGR